MKDGKFKKYYLALVEGIFTEKEGTINLPISRKENSIIERCVDFENGKTSITHYKVLKEFNKDNLHNNIENNSDINMSLIECLLETGRTHQIRVHMAYIGHPLVGDTLYGNKNNTKYINGQELYCYKLEFEQGFGSEGFGAGPKILTITADKKMVF